ncbi:MAG: DNA replication protein [Bacillota bacterium]
MNNHESKCVLQHACKLAGSPRCNSQCGAFIAIHGASGQGGRLGASNVPPDYRLLTFANLPAITVKIGAKSGIVTEILRNYTNSFSRQFDRIDNVSDRIKSLYLFSPASGTGKTSTACALINEWLIAHYVISLKLGRQPELRPAFFLDVNDWQTDYNQFNRAKVPESIAQPAANRYYTAMERAKQAPFAVLDDIGVRDMSEPFRADLHSVINHRVTNQLPTVYTSNIPMAELPLVFGEQRLYDRVRDLTMEIAFEGGSKRGMRK